jgi:acetyl esterase/lipase
VGFAAINHRLSPMAWKDPKLSITGVRHPEHIKDCARAFVWLRSNIKSYGADPNSIFVSGYSSGGHLAVLLALDSRYLKELNVSSGAIKAVISVGGAYDLVKYHEFLVNEIGRDRADAHLKAVFGPTSELWRDASPTSYLQNCSVPMLLIAEKDKGLRQYTEDFKQAAEKANIDSVKFLVAEDRSHKQSPGMMSRKGEDSVRDAIIKFIREYCCKDAERI